MITKKPTIPVSDQDEISVTLPATALAALGWLPGNQIGSGRGIPDCGSPIAAAATQSEPFPCFKKSAWSDRMTVTITQARTALGAA